jgi:hypothetical protein
VVVVAVAVSLAPLVALLADLLVEAGEQALLVQVALYSEPPTE